MRLFLAIDLPREAKKQLSAGLEDLKTEYRDFRWVPEENYHITLHFFGEVSGPEKLTTGVEEALFDIPKLNLYSSDADLFINSKIVTYLNFRRDKNLELVVERLRSRFGTSSNKKFLPHISLARYRVPSKQQYLLIKKKIRNLSLDVEFEVSNVTLFESILNKGKPIYNKMAEFPLDA